MFSASPKRRSLSALSLCGWWCKFSGAMSWDFGSSSCPSLVGSLPVLPGALCSFSVTAAVCRAHPSESEREEQASADGALGSVMLLLCFSLVSSLLSFLSRRHASANADRVFGRCAESSSPKCLCAIVSQSVASLLSCSQSRLLVSVKESSDGRSRFSAIHCSARCGRVSSRAVAFESGESVIFRVVGKDRQSSVPQVVSKAVQVMSSSEVNDFEVLPL